MDFELNTPKEIWEAKKILYESDTATKKSFMNATIALISVSLLLLLCMVGNSDSWSCDIEGNKKNEYYCTEVRRNINCKSISGPIHANISIKFDNETKASAEVVCPWEIAVSELRFCFTLLSLVSLYLGFSALKKESKKLAELHYQTGIFLSILLAIAAYFDTVSISNSDTNNHNFCNLDDEFRLEEGISGTISCGFTFYNITVIIELVSALTLFLSSYNLNKWKTQLVTDNL